MASIKACVAVVLVSACALVASTGALARQPAAVFEAGAAQVDVTPPLRTAATDTAEFVPACGLSAAQVAALWPGPRQFAFEKPYVDLLHAGQYVPGDPFCDADHTHRYEAPYLAGGSGQNHWPASSDDPADGPLPLNSSTGKPDAPDPLSAQAVVFADGGTRVAVVTVDSIGLFDTTMDQIRAAAVAADRHLSAADIFISSTHNESAPDPIGLWGPDPSKVEQQQSTPSGVTSGVDEYYMQYLVQRVAQAIVQADTSASDTGPLGPARTGLQPVRLRFATAQMPANTQSCWSSYPFIDAQLTPVMQGVAAASGKPVFTLVNGQTHDESLAFSGNPAYRTRYSGDWPGRMRADLEAAFPGSVALEMSGLVGSVETPTVYEPASTQVIRVPGPLRGVKGNPDGCSSVYPSPASGTPVADAETFIGDYGVSVASTVIATLRSSSPTVVAATLQGQSQPVCVQLENQLFIAAFAAGLFPDRPIYADPSCTGGAALGGSVATTGGGQSAGVNPSEPVYLRTEVGVATIGPAQIAYSPGEVFPFTELGGPVDAAQMPFPTACFEPDASNPGDGAAGDFYCGSALPDTPEITSEMTGRYKFLAGLGEDMIGYLFPPGNFVGSQAETIEAPWGPYEDTNANGHDRFGYGHADDAESVGPRAGLAVTDALQSLLERDPGPRPAVLPGLFVDAAGHLCDSPFPAAPAPATSSWISCPPNFSGAVGIEVQQPDGKLQLLRIGVGGVSGWAAYDGSPDRGTAGTADRYSVSTRGVIIDGRPLLIDVFTGAHDLGLPGT